MLRKLDALQALTHLNHKLEREKMILHIFLRQLRWYLSSVKTTSSFELCSSEGGDAELQTTRGLFELCLQSQAR